MASITSKLVQGAKNAGGSAINAIAKNPLTATAGAAAALKLLSLHPPTTTNPVQQSLTFPNDLTSSGPDGRNFMFQMQFQTYRRRSILDPVRFLSPTDGASSVYLPIPNSLVDTQTVTYGEEGADAAVGAGIEQGINSGSSDFGSMLGAAGNILSGLGLDKARAAAAGAPNGLKVSVDQLLQLGGVAQNPFLTVLFKSPTFKQHQFSWKLSPNNVEETNKVRDIIKTIRFNMLPALSPGQGGTLLSYPNIAIIKLFPQDEYLYRFKPCVIESMSVNFAPANTPSFFKNVNAPVEVQLSLSLKEIEYWLQEDVQ